MPLKIRRGKKYETDLPRTASKYNTSNIEEQEDYRIGKEFLKPYDQLELNEKELEEKITRILKIDNPNTAVNTVVYSFKECSFIPVNNIPQTEILYSLKGSLKSKITEENIRDQQLSRKSFEIDDDEADEGDSFDNVQTTKLRNMFNFHDRASLTNIKLCKNISLQTEPPPCSIFVGNATQWEMFDTYITDEKIKEKEKLRSSIKIQKKSENLQDTSEDLNKLLPNAKIMERMLNLTIFDEIVQDFKYWEDPSDAFRNSGSLLPLWKFNKPATIQIQYEVTCLCWNPYYSDLFAVGLGSYDFVKQYQGEIFLYSLKCPTHPEIIINVDTTVCSLDFHYEKGHLLAVGLYDGTVSIYKLKKAHNKLFLTSKDPNNKHFDPVWQIKWLSNDFDDNLNFISLSGDGRVINWIIVKNELKCSEIVVLKKEDCHLEGPEGIQLKTISCGTALSFNKYDKALFVVGTEDGLIHKCSLSYSGRFLETYKYHSLRISKLQWNPYHPRIFISCSADWLVCIWDCDVKEPLFEFHMKHKVDDVSWAPYSSTIFAAITDRKVYVYDLTVNKESYICQQVVTSGKKTNANHIAFNSMHPIIIVGDNRGNVLSFKLSPNLRKNLNVANRDKEEFIKSEAEKFEELVTMF